MTDKELMQEVLEALKLIDDAMPFPVAKLAMKNLRERLAQPEQEPVAWILEWVEDGEVYASKLYESERRCRYDAKKDTNAVCRTLVYGDKLKEKNNG